MLSSDFVSLTTDYIF